MSTHDVFGPEDKYRLEEREAPFHIVYESRTRRTQQKRSRKRNTGRKKTMRGRS